MYNLVFRVASFAAETLIVSANMVYQHQIIVDNGHVGI